MPLLKNRDNHVKVWRPKGTKYSEADGLTIDGAISKAYDAFYREFNNFPKSYRVVIEVVGTSLGYKASVFGIVDLS